MTVQNWTVRLAAAAALNFRQILQWTLENFGQVQARVYSDILSSAIISLSSGSSALRAKERSDIGKNIWPLHVARGGQKGRHFVIFRLSRVEGQHCIDVLRLSHDSMDLERHIAQINDIV